MKIKTLCYPIQGDKILLGIKKRGFGKGKINGFGGGLEDGETVEEAALRELEEEVSLKTNVNDLKKVAELEFYFPACPEKEWDQIVHVFFVNSWEGEPKESEEMNYKLFNINELPYHEMWDGDKYWLPLILLGKKIKGKLVFEEDNQTIKNKIICEI